MRAANSGEMTCALARELYHSDAPTTSWGWEERGAVNLRRANARLIRFNQPARYAAMLVCEVANSRFRDQDWYRV